MRKLASVLAFIIAVSPVFGTVLMSDNFDRANGNLITSGDALNATSDDGLWTVYSTTAGAGRIQTQDGQIILNQKSNREDIARSIGATLTTGNTFYASFDVTVGDLSGGLNVTSTGSLYFATFKDSGTSNFPTRISITAPTGSGNFAFALSYPSGTYITGLGDGVYGQTYKIVTSYNMDGTAKLWINPVDALSPSISVQSWTNTAVSTFAFREVTSNNALTTQTIDNLVVATTFAEVPEPATMILLGLGGLLFARKK